MAISGIFRWIKANQGFDVAKALKEGLLFIISFIRFKDISVHECMPKRPEPDVKVIS
jgi:hypothetical protein